MYLFTFVFDRMKVLGLLSGGKDRWPPCGWVVVCVVLCVCVCETDCYLEIFLRVFRRFKVSLFSLFSCYSLMMCRKYGHDIVALANLHPPSTHPSGSIFSLSYLHTPLNRRHSLHTLPFFDKLVLFLFLLRTHKYSHARSHYYLSHSHIHQMRWTATCSRQSVTRPFPSSRLPSPSLSTAGLCFTSQCGQKWSMLHRKMTKW